MHDEKHTGRPATGGSLTRGADKPTRRAYFRAYYAANKKRIAERRKELFATPAYKARKRAYQEANRDAIRNRLLGRAYGMTLAEFQRKVADQQGLCANKGCGKTLSDLPPSEVHVDHCHDSGVVRGVLCKACNISLGNCGESASRLRGLADYAEAWSVFK